MAHEEALTKIFSNLVNNAVKYAQKTVVVRLLPSGQEQPRLFTIEFENDGQVIPVSMREKVFEPFYRLKESLKQQGTGIGLALAASLTQLHQGELYIRNSPEGLNVFVLTLPVNPAKPTAGKMKKKRLQKNNLK